VQIHDEMVSVVNAFFGFDPRIQGLRVKRTQNQLLWGQKGRISCSSDLEL